MRWQDMARSQDGVISRAQLRAAGVCDGSLHELCTRRALDRQDFGVYLVAGAPLTYRARLWSAVLATGGCLAFHTAAELWGMTDERHARIHVLLPHPRRITRPTGVVVHRRRSGLGAVTRLSSLPVTTRPDTVVDQLAVLPARAAMALADRALQRRWLAGPEIRDRLRAHPKRPGNAQLRRIAAQLEDGAAAESERRLHRILRAAGIRGWRPNHRIWVGGELIAVVDVALPESRLAIEVDGMAYHVDVDRFQKDRTRQNALVAIGWTVLRFTWADVSERPQYVLSVVRDALE